MATKTLMTAAEFLQTGAETDGFELVRGRLVPRPPSGIRSGEVCVNAIYLVKSYVKSLGRGTVLGNGAGLIMEQGPDSVRRVDVAVFLNPSWQGQPAPAGYTSEAPDLAVEVRSPTRPWSEVLVKVGEYVRMGIRLIWVIDPQRQRVTVFSSDQEPVTFSPENELDGGTILPRFRCRVAELFE